MATMRRIGINPLPWILTDLGYRLDDQVVDKALADISEVGFRAMTLEIPSDMGQDSYLAQFERAGVAPAPGYFSGAFHDRERHAALVEALKPHAELHLAAGLDRAFIAVDLDPVRIATPAQGVETDPERSKIVAEGLALAADAAATMGVRYALHPHVGSWVEVESEVRDVLAATAGSALAFGPDTGHLQWAGADTVAVIADHAERVIALHVKDVDADAARAAATAGDDYLAATTVRHVWTEPGRGSVDFARVFASLPEDWDGWTVLEVDVPNVGDAVESSRVSLEWLASQPFGATTAVAS